MFLFSYFLYLSPIFFQHVLAANLGLQTFSGTSRWLSKFYMTLPTPSDISF